MGRASGRAVAGGAGPQVPTLYIIERAARAIDSHVRERAQAFTAKARAAMAEFPDSPYQRALYSVAELVTQRDH